MALLECVSDHLFDALDEHTLSKEVKDLPQVSGVRQHGHQLLWGPVLFQVPEA